MLTHSGVRTQTVNQGAYFTSVLTSASFAKGPYYAIYTVCLLLQKWQNQDFACCLTHLLHLIDMTVQSLYFVVDHVDPAIDKIRILTLSLIALGVVCLVGCMLSIAKVSFTNSLINVRQILPIFTTKGQTLSYAVEHLVEFGII